MLPKAGVRTFEDVSSFSFILGDGMHWGVYALFRPRRRGSLGLNGAIVSLRPLAGYGDRPGQGDSSEFIQLAKRVRNFSKRGNINGAISTLKHIKKIGYSWNSHLYLHLMEAYGYHKRWKEAMNVFRQIPNPNMYHYTYMLALYGRLGKTKEGMSLFKEMVNSGIEPGIIAYNSLLLGVAKAGEVDKVDIIFKEIKKSGLVPTGITYNTLVHLHARRGDSKGRFSSLPTLVRVSAIRDPLRQPNRLFIS